MKTYFATNWQLLAALGVLAVAGTFFFCKATGGCFAADEPRSDPRPAMANPFEVHNRTSNGGEEMSAIPAQGEVTHANQASFEGLVLNADLPVLVDFYADWCAPCRALGPVLEQVARETPQARVVKVNVDDDPALAAQYAISSIPCLLVFRDGEVSARHVGLATKAQLKAMLTR